MNSNYEIISNFICFQMSNEIIRRCCSNIDLDRIFDGYVQSGITNLNDCIECCQEWKEVYDKVRLIFNSCYFIVKHDEVDYITAEAAHMVSVNVNCGLIFQAIHLT